MRIPKHIGIIPDGNRRWAQNRGMEKADGYSHGISPGMTLYYMCRELGIEEMSFYGFTVDNTKRPTAQRQAFTKACVAAVGELSKEDASLDVYKRQVKKCNPFSRSYRDAFISRISDTKVTFIAYITYTAVFFYIRLYNFRCPV